MKRKHYKKRHNSAPRLTKLDKAIYNVAIVLSGVILLTLVLGLLFLRRSIAFSEAGTVALAETWEPLLSIPLLLFLFLSGVIFFLMKKQDKVAIFGDKKAKYAWGEEPFFSKNKHPKTERQKKKRRIALTAWFVGLAICLLLAAPGVFSRTTLTEDYHLHHYNMFNAQEEEAPERFEAVELKIFNASSGSRYSVRIYWTFSVSVRTAESNQTFRYDAYSTRGLDDMLDWVEGVVDRADRFTVKNAEKARKLFEERNMTQEQIARFSALLARAGE